MPIAAGELVADQPVCRGGIRNAEQRLRHAHQEHAFLGRQVVLMQERFHSGGHSILRAHGFDPGASARMSASRTLRRQSGERQEPRERLALVGKKGGAKRIRLWSVR